MRRSALAAALLLPFLVLGGSIAVSERDAKGASIWRIPVAGYDPRDPLRGHYVRFRYAWEVRGQPQLCRRPADCALCLEEAGAAVRVTPPGEPCTDRIDHTLSGIGLRYAPEFEGTSLGAFTRIYVSEASAPRLTRMLQNGPAVVVARLTRDGRLIPDRLEPAR